MAMGTIMTQFTALLLFFVSLPALAGVSGNVSVESTGFMKRAVERPEFLATIGLAPSGDFENRLVEARIEMLSYVFVNNVATFSPESPEAYVSTRRGLLGEEHQFTFGRRKMEWTSLESGMNFLISSWSPRFAWNPFQQNQVGHTGLFYTYQRNNFRLTALATPMAIPERPAPGGSPWADPNPTSVNALGREVPLRYDLSNIPYGQIIFRPGAALSLRYGEEEGPWIRGNYGIMGSNTVNVGVLAKLDPNKDIIEASILARGLHDERVSFEAGYEGGYFSTWASANHVRPVFMPTTPAGYIVSAVGTGTIVGVGGELRLKNGIRFQSGYAKTWEVQPKAAKGEMTFDMGGRYAYSSLFRLNAQYQGESRMTYGTGLLFDTDKGSQLFSLDIAVRLGKRTVASMGPWLVGVGADFFASETGKGAIGKFRGNDLLRARVAYLF